MKEMEYMITNNDRIFAITHSGIFHADEVMASVILKQRFDEVEIMRSRDRRDFADADIVFDVGDGIYDHHSDLKEYRDNGIPYAACGLIWRDFGHDVIRKLAPKFSLDQIDEVFYSVDGGLIQSIDAIDNGYPIEKADIHMPTVDQLVKGFNPKWNANQDSNMQFEMAIEFCTPILLNTLHESISAIEAEEVVKKSLLNREVENILVLDRFCPWKRHLRNHDIDGNIIYVIFKDLVNGYRVQAVSEPDSRDSIKPFPEEWAGKDADLINEMLDIDDAIFVHPGRFIAGTGSLDSAMRMAEFSLIY